MEELKINMRKIIRDILDEYIAEKRIKILKPRKSIKKPDLKGIIKNIKRALGGFITRLRNLKVKEFFNERYESYKNLVSKHNDEKLARDREKLKESIKRREAKANGS